MSDSVLKDILYKMFDDLMHQTSEGGKVTLFKPMKGRETLKFNPDIATELNQ